MKATITVFLLALLTSASVAQWSEQSSGVTTTLHSVSAIDNYRAWICGAGGKVLRTTNGGTNWLITASPNAALDLYNIWGIDATSALVTGSSSTTYVYKTTNEGASWTQVFSQSGGFIDAIVEDVSFGWFFRMIGNPVGGRWSLWYSFGGSTWDSTGQYIPQAGTETGYNNSAFFIQEGNHGFWWFGTNNTRVYYNGPGDTNWVAIPTPGQANSMAILFVDSLVGVIGGSTGMLSTTNGGTNWVGGTVPGSGSINGFAIGYNYGELFYSRGSSIYQTTNSGTNWVTATTQTGTYTHMMGARTADNYNIWAIRNNGGISKYTYPIGIKPISSEVPNLYLLYQNYPNPFNPITKIKFDIPKSSFTEIKIYDNLGREISTLVSSELIAGKYEVKWNAVNLPSGVYYYKISSGDFTDSKKMVLVK